MKKPLKSFDAPLQMKEAGWNGRLNGSLRTQRPGSILGRCNDFSSVRLSDGWFFWSSIQRVRRSTTENGIAQSFRASKRSLFQTKSTGRNVTHFSQADSPLSEMTALCSKVFLSPRSVKVSQYLILFGDKSKRKITATCRPESTQESSPRRCSENMVLLPIFAVSCIRYIHLKLLLTESFYKKGKLKFRSLFGAAIFILHLFDWKTGRLLLFVIIH